MVFQPIRGIGVKKIIPQIMCEAMWLSAYDVLIMLEQLPEYEEAQYNNVKVCLWDLAKSGVLEMKKGTYRTWGFGARGTMPSMYRLAPK